MKHLILGTAGHVDHGKTSLVKALTGIDCDTHPQEKARGITINLGFAHLALPSGTALGIVDVPGHRDFVHTMVSGAAGIDLAMLVIAADESVMPQTREHLEIMQILGVKRGLVALTKADLVDADLLYMATEEVRAFADGTFLAGAPVVPVSSVTRQGLDSLVTEIDTAASGAEARPADGVFRMYIDRIFSVAGFGTVVTGSVLSGTLGVDDRIFLCPGDREVRVRRLERHGNEAPSVVAGDRASLNLVGLDREDFRRGMLVAGRPQRASTLLDVRLRLFGHARPLALWTQAVVLTGTYEAQARVHLIDRDTLRGGGEGLAQIQVPAPCAAQTGDRFVLRNSSSDTTLGGGEILDPAPLHHRRRTARLVEQLSTMAQGKLPELIALEVRKHAGPVTAASLADALNVSAGEVSRILLKETPPGVAASATGDAVMAIDGERLARFRDVTVRRIAAFHRANPLRAEGLSVEELFGILGLVKTPDHEAFVRRMLADLEKAGQLKQVKHTWAQATHAVKADPEMDRQVRWVEDHLRKSGMQTPVMAEVAELAARQGIDAKRLGQILRYLVSDHRAYEAEGAFLHASVVDAAREKLVAELKRRPAGLTVAQFRDLVGGNRKICLLMYAIFDAEGTTERQGDVRVRGRNCGL